MIQKFKESSTFKIVVVSWLIVTWAFIYTVTKTNDVALITGLIETYAQSASVILAVWVGREWKEKHYNKD